MKNVEDIAVFLPREVFNSDNFSIVSINEKSYFRTESANIKIKSFEKHGYPLRTLSDKAVKGTAVNQTLSSFHETGGSLGITLKLHLKTIRVEYN